MKNLIFLTDNIFLEKDYRRFNVKFLKKYFKIQIYSFVKLINPNLLYNFRNFKILELKEIKNIINLRSQLKYIKNTIFIDFLGSSSKAWKIRRIIKKENIPILKFYNGRSPSPNFSFIERLKNLFYKKKQSGGNIINKTTQNIINYLNKDFTPDIALVGGDYYEKFAKKKKIKKIIKIHSWDYDEYLKIRHVDKKTKNYIVFIENNVPNHPDYIYHKAVPPVKKEIYYKSLNKFFDKIEKKTKFKIKIAASPKSNMAVLKKNFSNRSIYKHNTATLIKQSNSVILHKSTSIFYVLKYNKPVLFITSNGLKDTWYNDQIMFNSNLFKMSPLNIDEKFFVNKNNLFKKINKKISKQYMQINDKSINSGNELIWEIFVKNMIEKKNK